MPFDKGHTKKGGRTRGTPNADTALRRTLLSDFMAERWEPFLRDAYPQLSPKEQADFIRAVLPYLFPRMASVEVSDRRESAQTALEAIRRAMGES